MKISQKQLINLLVYTELDHFVGHVVGFEIDVDTHGITTYVIGKNRLVNGILSSLIATDHLLVSPAQVVAITEERMVIKDAVVLAHGTGSTLESSASA